MHYSPGQFYPSVPRHELKDRAKMALSGRWGSAVLALVVYMLLSAGSGIIPFAPIFLIPPFVFGLQVLYLRLYRHGDGQVENIFKGFDLFGKVLGVYWLSALYIFLWSLLFYIPGIVAAYRYSQAVYILYDNPEITVSEALRRSRDMMYGNKLTLFIQDLSFLGWFILSIFPGFYIGFLWSMPYFWVTRAAFYDSLLASGAHSEQDQSHHSSNAEYRS